MPAFNAISHYLRSARAQRSLNLRGLPGIPKSLWRAIPSNRLAFNRFVLWIERLELGTCTQVIDVGANHGDFAQAASALFPEACVLLVEPLTILHPELQARAAERHGRWAMAGCALGAEHGSAILHVAPERDDIASLVGFGSEYRAANRDVKAEEELTCEVWTLDDLCSERGIKQVDLLKVDVEGFEFEVLAGGEQTLSQTRAVVIEVSLVRRSEQGDALERMLGLLRKLGFHILEILPSYFDPDAPWRPVEFNVLARRS